MKLKIENTVEQKLLSRKAVSASILFDKATPSNGDLQKALADALKVAPEVVAVKGIYTAFGISSADIFAYVYGSKELLDKFEPKKRNKRKKKKKK